MKEPVTLEAVCGILSKEAWYPLGIWLGVEDSELKYIKRHHLLTNHLKIIKKVLENFYMIIDIMKETQKFLGLLSKCFPIGNTVWFSETHFTEEAGDYITKLEDSLLKRLAKKFLQDVLCKREKIIVNALIKIGLKDKVEEIKGIILHSISIGNSMFWCVIWDKSHK